MNDSERRLVVILAACLLLAAVLWLALGPRLAAQAGTITVDPNSLTISEPDGSDTFTIKPGDAPTATVTIDLSTNNNQCSVSPTSVSITTSNYFFGVSVTVTAADDGIADGTQTCIVQTAPSVSDDPDYNGIDPEDVTVTVNDAVVSGVKVTPTSVSVSEAGATDAYQVVLESEPGESVTISINTDTQVEVSEPSLVFDQGNWQEPVTVTVTAVDDSLIEGQHSGTITHTVDSNDAAYNSVAVDDVTVTIQDNDAAGVTVTPTAIDLVEGGASATYQVVLDSQPRSQVTISIITDDQVTADASSLAFSRFNWSNPRTVTVTAVDDNHAEGQHVSTIIHDLSSNDSDYSGLDPDDVIATIQDDDTAGIDVAPTDLTVSEPDGSAAFTMTLTSQPVLSVTIALTTSNQECAVSPTSVFLDGDNWGRGARVTVSAVDDDVDDGIQTCVVETAIAVSDDPVYDGRNPADVSVTVLDDDAADIVVEPLDLTVSEPNGTAVFSITLASKPSAAVTVPLSTSSAQCTVAPDSVILDDTNWSGQSRITVTAADDSVKDGDQTCLVRTEPASSSDPRYNSMDADDVTVTVLDDEQNWKAYLPHVLHGWPPIPEAPVIQPIDNSDGDGTYTVSWSTALRAETYILEEAKDSSFAGATVIYSGPFTSYTPVDRGAARYYYRVKSRNRWGDSGWSSARWVDVVWEKEPDDFAQEANGPIISGLTYYGTFPTTGDVNDYYYFDLAAAGRVELWLRKVAPGENYELVLRDWPNLNPVGYSGEVGSSDEHILLDSLPAARYYVHVFNRTKGGSSQAYEVQVNY